MLYGKLWALSSLAVITFAAPAHAYIDPGAGTLIVQGFIGSFVAITAFAGMYIQRIRAAIGRLAGKTKGSEDNDPK
ncbi:hypothetical protein [Thalassobius sp. I31.1]|uniref:hypothetical protein n=1 Tax=Thalassobius sp. I31.1 TaxID=2109912 RepID=UPI0013003202|nr:hypothetical protein [Thalassobius sp. I31.1]